MKRLISPDILVPMNAHTGSVDDLERVGVIFEPKLDGIRALCYVDDAMTFYSRNRLTITDNYPEFDFRSSIKAKSAILDGEIVALDKENAPRFSLWQQGSSAHYIVFDILMLNGKMLLSVPLLERKKLLEQVILPSNNLELCLYTHEGKALWQEMKKRSMEGIVAKVSNSLYYPGKRSNQWIKIKLYKTLEALIVGYTFNKRAVSSLVLGIYDENKNLTYIGKVGTGFNENILQDLLRLFSSLTTDKPQLKNSIKNIVWLKPKVIAEIKYLEFTQSGVLRSPVFLRVRPDKDPEMITFKEQELRV